MGKETVNPFDVVPMLPDPFRPLDKQTLTELANLVPQAFFTQHLTREHGYEMALRKDKWSREQLFQETRSHLSHNLSPIDLTIYHYGVRFVERRYTPDDIKQYVYRHFGITRDNCESRLHQIRSSFKKIGERKAPKDPIHISPNRFIYAYSVLQLPEAYMRSLFGLTWSQVSEYVGKFNLQPHGHHPRALDDISLCRIYHLLTDRRTMADDLASAYNVTVNYLQENVLRYAVEHHLPLLEKRKPGLDENDFVSNYNNLSFNYADELGSLYDLISTQYNFYKLTRDQFIDVLVTWQIQDVSLPTIADFLNRRHSPKNPFTETSIYNIYARLKKRGYLPEQFITTRRKAKKNA